MELAKFCDDLIAKSKQLEFEELEVYGIDINNLEVIISDGIIQEYRIKENRGIYLMGVFSGEVGECYFENFGQELPEDMLNIIKKIATCSHIMKKRNLVGNVYNLSWKNQKKDLKEYINTILNMLDQHLKREIFVKTYNCQIILSRERDVLENSKGLKIDTKSYMGVMTCSITMEKEGMAETGFDVFLFKEIEDISFQNLKLLLEYIKYKFNKKKINAGDMRAIIGYKAMADLLAGFCKIFCANQEDNSHHILAEREGRQLFSKLLTITDDPYIKYNFREFDGEGIKTKKVNIIANGCLNTLMYNQEAAELSTRKSTGHAIRNFEGKVGIGSSNLYINSGSASLNEMIASIDSGILITEIGDIYSGINVESGEFECPGEGLVINEGKIVGATGQILIMGNFFEILKNIICIGDDFGWSFMYGVFGSPSVMVEKLKIEL